ncbi:MAG: peptidoglycan binding domain-containing protein [bacterium]|nr:peptidoglycan binding domain-containing protein [bacterium]
MKKNRIGINVQLLKKPGIIYAILIFGLLSILTVNAVFAAMVEGKIYPGVKVANQNVGWLTRAETASKLKSQPQNYKLKITIDDKTFDLTTRDLGATYDIDKTTEAAYQIGRENFAITGLFSALKNGRNGYVYNLNNQKFNEVTSGVIDSVGRSPVNATLRITDGNIEVVPPQSGLRVNPKLLRQAISDSFLMAQDQKLTFTPVIVEADIQPKDTLIAQDKAKQYLAKKFILNYSGRTFSPTPADIGHWLVFEPVYNQDKTQAYLNVRIDDTQIKGYVQAVANEINIVPVNKKVVISNGVTSVEREGKEGLAIDQDSSSKALSDAARANQDLSYNIPSSKIAFKTEYNEVVALGYSKYIEINLSSQHLWAYQDNQVVYSSPLTSGATGAGFPTVTGLFSIYYKTTGTYLDGRPYGWNYNVFVQYWMPFYAGYGLHDASWRSSFGGRDYYYNGSHGCVNLPLATAAFLYSWSEVGTPVWVHN